MSTPFRTSLLASLLLSGVAGQCHNTVAGGPNADEGCTIASLPVCVGNGMELGFMAEGDQCVACTNSNHHAFDVIAIADCGCPTDRPTCVMDDGTTSPTYNFAGTQCVGDGPAPNNGDLNVRFNKFWFTAAAEPDDWTAFGPDDYPISIPMGETLKFDTNAISVMTADDFALHGRQGETYIDAVGGLPTYPNSDPTNPFWSEMEIVTDYQIERLNNNDAFLFPLPDLWAGHDINTVAENVHDEYPAYWQALLLEKFWGDGVQLDYNIVPKRCNADFIGGPVLAADLNTWAVRKVSPINFRLKWSGGRPRPEEVAWKIATDEITVATGAPAGLVAKIKGMNLGSATEFTKYPEGSPRHPAWPAMHSAASSASLWMAVMYDLSAPQLCEARMVDYAVAFARTVAGVHYPTDNTVGLNLGQMIMAEELADHLAEEFGSDRNAVQAKIESLMFDWETFNPADCSHA